MKLILTLLGPPRLMGARQVCELRLGSLAIGRSPEADWVIPDVDRLISRLHLRIDASFGEFVLTDTSVNGVYVNGSDESVGYGASVRLRDGDRMRAGDAQIAVRIEGEAGDAPGNAPKDRARAERPVAEDRDAEPSRDPLGGPFGAAPAAPVVQTLVGADWMNPRAAPPPTVGAALPASPPDADRPAARTDPVPFPQRSTRPTLPSRDTGADLAALVADRPDLSAGRLAALVDTAAREIDPAAWRALRDAIRALLRDG